MQYSSQETFPVRGFLTSCCLEQLCNDSMWKAAMQDFCFTCKECLRIMLYSYFTYEQKLHCFSKLILIFINLEVLIYDSLGWKCRNHFLLTCLFIVKLFYIFEKEFSLQLAGGTMAQYLEKKQKDFFLTEERMVRSL